MRSTLSSTTPRRPSLMPLRTIARCLRGMAFRLASSSPVISLRKVTYSSFVCQPRRPGGSAACRGIPGGRRPAVAPVRARPRRASCARHRCRRGRAAVHAERHRAERVAEQPALDFRERQHALDLAVLLHVIEPGLDAERAFDHLLPAGQVEEGGVGAAAHERVPAAVFVRLQHVQGHGGGGQYGARPVWRCGFDDRVHGRFRKMLSMRSHAKSRARDSMRRSIRSMLM
jgi:hypothetical protein